MTYRQGEYLQQYCLDYRWQKSIQMSQEQKETLLVPTSVKHISGLASGRVKTRCLNVPLRTESPSLGSAFLCIDFSSHLSPVLVTVDRLKNPGGKKKEFLISNSSNRSPALPLMGVASVNMPISESIMIRKMKSSNCQVFLWIVYWGWGGISHPENQKDRG